MPEDTTLDASLLLTRVWVIWSDWGSYKHSRVVPVSVARTCTQIIHSQTKGIVFNIMFYVKSSLLWKAREPSSPISTRSKPQVCSMFIQCTSSSYLYENKNSLRTGDPENSGFSSMQLCRSATLHLLWGYTNLRKYCNFALRFSRNFGRNFEITLFGGKGGIAAWEYGKVWRSLCRRSSNSEYRFRIRMVPPCDC